MKLVSFQKYTAIPIFKLSRETNIGSKNSIQTFGSGFKKMMF